MFNDYMLACDTQKVWQDFIAPYLEQPHAGLDISLIGPLVYCDDEGQEISRNDAYHVNVRINPEAFTDHAEFTQALLSTEGITLTHPKTPSRVWA